MPENQLDNIMAMGQLTKLKEVYLANNNLSTLPDLSLLRLLKSLDISENAISDIKPLYNCQAIEYLNIRNTMIDDISGIGDLSNLERFYFDQTFVKDIHDISQLKKIKSLELSSSVTDLSPLSQLTSLDNLIYRDPAFKILLGQEELLNDIISRNPNLTILTDYYGQSNDDNLSYAYCSHKEIEGDYSDIQSGKAKRTADTVLKLVKSITSDDMSDYEKVHAIHKYICHRLDYGYGSSSDISSYSMAYVPVNVLHSNKALSPGYTRLMDSFLRIAGLESRIIRSNTSPYVWNLVKVDNRWYHIDATSNDSFGKPSSSKWKLFLVSDEKMRKTGHRTWDTKRYPVCSKSYTK